MLHVGEEKFLGFTRVFHSTRSIPNFTSGKIEFYQPSVLFLAS